MLKNYKFNPFYNIIGDFDFIIKFSLYFHKIKLLIIFFILNFILGLKKEYF